MTMLGKKEGKKGNKSGQGPLRDQTQTGQDLS